MSDYKLDVEVAVSGDGKAKDRLKSLERFMESARSRAAALNRLKISPAIAIDDRISAPLRSVRADLERAGSMYLKVFRNAGAGVTESIKPVFDSIADWFDFCRTKVDWWKSSLIQAGRDAAEMVLGEFQRAYSKIKKMFLDNLNLNLYATGKLLVEHKVIAFINTLGRNNTAPAGQYPSGDANKNDSKVPKFIKDGLDNFSKVWSGFSEGIAAADKMGNSNMRQKIKDSKAGQAITKAAKTVGGIKIGDRTLGEIGSGAVSRAADGVSNVAKTVSEVKAGRKNLGEIGSGVVNFGKKALGGAAEVTRHVPFIGKAMDLVNIAIADDKNRAIAQTAGGAVGAWAGAKAGALIGSLVFPGVGTAVGGVLGGIAGSFAGDWLAGKAMDKVRSRDSEAAINPYSARRAPMPATSPAYPAEGVQNQNKSGSGDSGTQNLTINVSVDGDLDRAELARFIAVKIAAEVQKITQNTPPNAAPALGG